MPASRPTSSGLPASSTTPPPGPTPGLDASEELVAFPSDGLTLHGFLYRPRGDGPFPAVVFNHGSERQPGDKRGQAEFYVSHGFVLFVPHRRGQGQPANVAEYIIAHAADHARAVAELASTQTDDVMSAVEYVRSLPYVDRTRVAVAGCSFGGIVSLFAAERGTGKPVRVHVFPANGTTHEEGHGFCVGGEHPGWGDEVLEFLKTASQVAK